MACGMPLTSKYYVSFGQKVVKENDNAVKGLSGQMPLKRVKVICRATFTYTVIDHVQDAPLSFYTSIIYVPEIFMNVHSYVL